MVSHAAMDNQHNNVTNDYSIPVQPVVGAAWRGRFNIPSRNLNINIVAHASNKACMQVLEVASRMPDSLCLEMFSRPHVWPASFKSAPPTEHSIALFFFPLGRDKEVLDSLLSNAIYNDLALKTMIGKAELLIFTSLQLPEKLHRFRGNLYLWGVFRGQEAAAFHQSDNHVHIEKTRVKQSLSSNAGRRRSFEEGSPITISSKHSPSTHAIKADKRGRHLDDAWEYAKPLDELRQKAECRYCGFVSSHGGISRLKAHLGGGHPRIRLPGCHEVSPEVKKLMADWFSEWVKNTKALWTKGIRAEMGAHIDERGRLHIAMQHANPLDVASQNTECKYFGFVSLHGGVQHNKEHLVGEEEKMHIETWSKMSPEIKGVMSERVKTLAASRPHEVKRGMSGWEDISTSRKKKSHAAGAQDERRGRPLDVAWEHAKALDQARQKTQCNYCGFVSSYGGISRLKAHLGGGCPEMQLQGCPHVPLEVKELMEQWFNEWAKYSTATWTRKSNAPPKSLKRGRLLEDTLEHAILLDELRQATRCKYCGFVSKHGGIARLKAHLGGGDPTMQVEGCPNVFPEVKRSMAEGIKKCRTKPKTAPTEAVGETQRRASSPQWFEKRHHILQETIDEITNISLKESLQKLIYEKNARVQKMQYEIQSLESQLASMP